MAQRTQYLERAHQIAVHDHDRTRVVELTAVVGRTEYGQQLAVCLELVAVLDHLVRPADEVQSVPGEKVGDNVVSESVGYTSARKCLFQTVSKRLERTQILFHTRNGRACK